uniref:Uncharacterized protein n=1 Tax=Rhizophora mucronata TaxID=61149 RepID=A0A2P2PHY7_RHIMU
MCHKKNNMFSILKIEEVFFLRHILVSTQILLILKVHLTRIPCHQRRCNLFL